MRPVIIILILALTGCSFNRYSPSEKAMFYCTVAGQAGDYVTTEQALDRPGMYEMNPLLDDHPSDTQIAAFKAVTLSLFIIAAELLPKYRKYIYTTGCIAGVGATAFNTYQLTGGAE